MATDVVSPLIDVLVVPARTLAGVFDYFRDLSKIYDDNRKLRAENNRLQIVSDKARALEIENKLLAKLFELYAAAKRQICNGAGYCRRGRCLFAFDYSLYGT